MGKLDLDLPAGVSIRYSPAEDSSVDSEYTLTIGGTDAGGIQLNGGRYWANVWTNRAMDEMDHAPAADTLEQAAALAVALLVRHKWIPNPIAARVFADLGMLEPTDTGGLDWQAYRRDRAYFPETITGDRADVVAALEALLTARKLKFEVDAFTDQIDVYINRRKVAVYMP